VDAMAGKIKNFTSGISALYNIRNLSIFLCIVILKLFWDQSEINAFNLAIKAASLATPGKAENVLRRQLSDAHISITEKPIGYGSRFNKNQVLSRRFTAHTLVFSWGYEVIIYINPETREVQNIMITSFGEGV
jgi:hypothetical protein